MLMKKYLLLMAAVLLCVCAGSAFAAVSDSTSWSTAETKAVGTTDITVGNTGDVTFTITGLRKATFSNASLPMLENGNYVWKNAADSGNYYILDANGNETRVSNLVLLRYDGDYLKNDTARTIIEDSFVITTDGNVATVKLAIDKMGDTDGKFSAVKGLALRATRADGNGDIITVPVNYTLHANISSVNTVSTGTQSVTIGGDAVNFSYAISELEGPFNFILYRIPEWLVFLADNGVFRYTTGDLSGVTPGTYNFSALAYSGENSTQNSQHRLYNFTLNVLEAENNNAFSITASRTSRVVVINQTDSSISITPQNASGTVSYTSSASWVTVNSSGVVTIHPTERSLLGTTQPVTITATDSSGSTSSVTLSIRISAAGSSDVTIFTLTADIVRPFIRLGDTRTEERTAELYPTNAQGTVTYKAAVSPSEGLTVAFNGDIATFNATKEGSYTVTITGTDSSGQTASVNFEATVVSFKLYAYPDNLNINLGETGKGTSTASIYPSYPDGDVDYTASINLHDGLTVSFKDDPSEEYVTTATFEATKAGNYTVIITGTDSTGLKASVEIKATVAGGSVTPAPVTDSEDKPSPAPAPVTDSEDKPSPAPAPVTDSEDKPSPSPVPVPVPDNGGNTEQPKENERLDRAIIEPITPLDEESVKKIAQSVSADPSEIIFLTSADFDTSEPPEPTKSMKQTAKNDNYEFAAKLNTINVKKSGWYVFEVNVPDELVGAKVSDLKFYTADSSEFGSSSVKAAFIGEALISLFEVNSLVKPDTLAKKILVALFCNTSRSFTVYLAKILLMMLAGGCNVGCCILAGIVPLYFILRKNKK